MSSASNGRLTVITGANAGIGRETALDLARRGGRIILACRSRERAEEARQDIIRQTDNQNVVFRKLDLASLESVRQFAEEMKREEGRLDILINNAGLCWHSDEKTAEGFDLQFGVNHFGHFLLTNLLLDLLKKSAPSRILVVSSMMHIYGKLDFTPTNENGDRYPNLKSYWPSKLANILFAKELARRLEGTGVTVNSLHPGVIYTDLWDSIKADHGFVWGTIMKGFCWVLMKSAREGAQTTIHCAVEETLHNVTGRYFADCSIAEESEDAKDDGLAKKLWEVSAEVTGLE
ncbi:retinol dehydrogenase 13-like isoform X2 [Branchiostoma floridae]|uniref:Retinol dehydrogenase 13-like isoform X2 n=1 Tax=Branchiostoma floridae TaxID=7739 RepID=A0A9J7M0B6_BRAFL|nr:retinol dehydrogenase 13-like isoform X2 [Branchiostoma floridae]